MRQNKPKSKLLIAALIMSALLPNTARATNDDDCAAVVKAADRALADQDKVIDLKTKQITVQNDIILSQDKHITELEKRDSNFFKSPWFYLTLGLVVGGYIAGRTK
jgi:predicted exporter